MSKALLKRSLADVKARRQCKDDGEKIDMGDIKKNYRKKTPVRHSINVPDPKAYTVDFSERTRMKSKESKIITAISKNTAQSKRDVYLSPPELAKEKRKIRIDMRKKLKAIKSNKGREKRKQFSIFSIPHLNS